MGKLIHPDMLDGGLDAFKALEGSITAHLCSGDPADRAAAVAASLANVAIGVGDVTLANGDVSGRKYTIAAKTGVTTTTTGTPDTLCYVDGTRLLHKTDVSNPQVITAGNPVDFPSVKRESLQAA